MKPRVSIIIPAYNEEGRIVGTLESVCAHMDERGEPYEILVVDDGSGDATCDVVEKTSADLKRSQIRLVKNPRNLGKGGAVKNGVSRAQGEFVVFLDADNSSEISDIDKLIHATSRGYDVAVGSRALPGSVIPVRQPWTRQISGKVFRFLCGLMLGIRIRDTQCGFKCFRRKAAEKLFGLLTISGFCFDVELIYIALKLGMRVAEVPITWRDNPDTRVRFFKHSLMMFLDLLDIQLRGRKLA
jgi:dolichyl-phosphate beta-glucosyltransferase